MCRIKKADIQFKLFINEELIKVFRNKKMLEIFIKEYKIENYNVEVI